jgi:small redox-active disulfide protein 2
VTEIARGVDVKIEVLGTGCKKCDQLATAARAAADELKLAYELTHVRELARIAAYGVLMTPALVIDGTVKAVGRVPSAAELRTILSSAAAR